MTDISPLEIHRGDTLIFTFAVESTYTEYWFTVKDALNKTDAQAIVQIVQSRGLVVLNGKPFENGESAGTIAVENGVGTVRLSENQSALLVPAERLYYDIQGKGGVVKTLKTGVARITGDVTRSV